MMNIKEREVTETQAFILEILMKEGPLPRSPVRLSEKRNLERITKLPHTTLYDNLRKLFLKGYIQKQRRLPLVQGRPVTLWGLIEKQKRGREN